MFLAHTVAYMGRACSNWAVFRHHASDVQTFGRRQRRTLY